MSSVNRNGIAVRILALILLPREVLRRRRS